MQEYFIDRPLTAGDLIELPRDKAHHAFNVLHLQHETVRLVSNGRGYFAEVFREQDRGLARILSEDPSVNELSSDITLCMALIRREKFELVIQKATELGVSRIIPFVSSRCVAKDRQERAEKIMRRREAIALEAAEQCKRNRVPEVLAPVKLSDLKGFLSDVNIAAYEKAGTKAMSLKDVLPASSLTAVVGPEGGFSEAEVELLQEFGFSPVTLGNRILRAETAAYYICSVAGELCQ